MGQHLDGKAPCKDSPARFLSTMVGRDVQPQGTVQPGPGHEDTVGVIQSERCRRGLEKGYSTTNNQVTHFREEEQNG
jgi:hypothetical protein